MNQLLIQTSRLYILHTSDKDSFLLYNYNTWI